jgi:hypothetical protein
MAIRNDVILGAGALGTRGRGRRDGADGPPARRGGAPGRALTRADAWTRRGAEGAPPGRTGGACQGWRTRLPGPRGRPVLARDRRLASIRPARGRQQHVRQYALLTTASARRARARGSARRCSRGPAWRAGRWSATAGRYLSPRPTRRATRTAACAWPPSRPSGRRASDGHRISRTRHSVLSAGTRALALRIRAPSRTGGDHVM